MRKGDTGSVVANVQRQLVAAGFKIAIDSWFGAATEAAVRALQLRAGLVADGIVGPKTLAALLSQTRNPLHLGERDLQAAADRLGVELAAIKAVNQVESNGKGFLDDGRPVILFERHQLYRLLKEADDDVERLAERYPALINHRRGGYAGGAAEWARLAGARQICDGYTGLAEQACSWGQFQIMGYHWANLGYTSIAAFVAEMSRSEAAQLEAFSRFIEADAALLKALRARKWAEFARLYNGPAFKENLYDVKLARAYEREKGSSDETAVRAV